MESLDYARLSISTPRPLPQQHASGICRFLLQEIAPNFRLYVTPINVDPVGPGRPTFRTGGLYRRRSRRNLDSSTQPVFRKTTRRVPTASSTTMNSAARRPMSSKSDWRCSSTLSRTTKTDCCSSTSPAATCSRTCSGGTNRTEREHPIRSAIPKPQVAFNTSKISTNDSTRSLATSMTATAARQRSS